MDKNSTNNDSRNFFKREGFYVVLFVCLCIVAVTAVVSSKHFRKVKSQPPVAQQKVSKHSTVSKETANSSDKDKMRINNARQVKNDTKNKPVVSVPGNEKQSAQASSTVSMKFMKPVSGSLIQGYSKDPVEFKPENSSVLQNFKSVYGNYIGCKVGQDVYASEAGIVENVDNTRDGMTVTIQHNNGFKTVYSNLAEQVNITKGSKVNAGQKIGIVGKTAVNYPSYEDLMNGFLYFQIIKDNAPVDPSNYVKY